MTGLKAGAAETFKGCHMIQVEYTKGKILGDDFGAIMHLISNEIFRL